MSVTAILTASIALQLLAAVFALLLIRTTGLRSPWVLLSGAMVLQAVRRYMTLQLWLDAGQVGDGFLAQGLVSLLIAVLMLIAVVLVRPLFEEVTNRRREAERVAARFRAMFSDHGAVMLLLDARTGAIVEANRGASHFYGLPEKDLVGRRMCDFAAPGDETPKGSPVPGMQLTASGESVVESQCTDLVLDGRHYVYAVLTDVTARVIAEHRFVEPAEELEALVEELQESNSLLEELNNELHDRDAMRVRFLAAMSHELRTPLGAIVGFADLLHDGAAGDLNDEQRKQIGLIGESGRHVLHIVEEMLDVARIDSGHMELEQQHFEIGRLIERVAETLQPAANVKSIDLRLRGVDDVGGIFGDRYRSGQVLLNVIGNALKYTDSGHVEIRARRDGSRVVVEVEDTGCGIAPCDIDRVFDDYFRVTDGECRSDVGGAGLGLAVSRRLARLMGGDITAESVPGSGSTFTLVLPVR
jgi:signal transduction histidine kinase